MMLLKTLDSHFLPQEPPIGQREGCAPSAQSSIKGHGADQTLQKKKLLYILPMLFFIIFVFYIQIVK